MEVKPTKKIFGDQIRAKTQKVVERYLLGGFGTVLRRQKSYRDKP